MAKPVTIDTINEPFPTQKAAMAYFEAMKEQYEPGTKLEVIDATQVNAAFEQYCAVTSWPIPSGISSFSVDNKAEEISPGQFRTHKCFWYHLPDGSKKDFSIIRAIQEISRSQNS